MPRSRKTPDSRRLTPRQLEILQGIRDYRRSHGYSPTMQELADTLDVTKVTVFEHIEALIDKKLLRRAPHKARSLELTSLAEFPDERPTLLPLVGRIAAGAPVEAIEDAETLDLEAIFAGPSKRRYVLQVRGQSMIDDQIRDGDYVIVEDRNEIYNGDTVVALLNGEEATLKRYYREAKGKIRLQPANPSFKPIVVKADDVQVQGVVVGVVRRY